MEILQKLDLLPRPKEPPKKKLEDRKEARIKRKILSLPERRRLQKSAGENVRREAETNLKLRILTPAHNVSAQKQKRSGDRTESRYSLTD